MTADHPAARLAPTPDRDAATLLRAGLVEARHASGGWGQHPGHPPATEPTALATLALARTGGGAGDPRVRAGLAWLASRQRADGSWAATDAVPEGSWMTGDALLALAVLDVEPARRDRAATWLLGREGAGVSWLARLAEWWHERRGQGRAVDLDVEITAWPWAEGTFSWVEPTALALLALRAAAVRSPSLARDDRLRERVRLGERMLLDRVVPGGGWNYGNVRVLGEDLAPYPDTTAWALLALRGSDGRPVAGAGPAVAAGLDRLVRMLGANRSPLAHALGALALRAHGRDDALPRATLTARALDPNARWPETRSRALALLALAGPTFPLGA